MEKFAYATDDPAVLDAYRAAAAARREYGQRLRAAAADLGHNLGPAARRNARGREEIVGLRPDNSGRPPRGWRLVERGKRLAPCTSTARRWIVEHQPPAGTDPLEVLLPNGLVALSRVESGERPGDNYRDFRPVVFEWGGKLWACYKGSPVGVTWPQVPLAACLVAQAALEDSRRTAQTISTKETLR